ncbi:MAG: ester cyclase [Planctomycetes bacterium]|nr:ester cyclase [Planctomycetota bacterium]
MSTEANKAIVRQYYDDLWNTWDLDLADELLGPNVEFRGSLGVTVRGLDGFKDYVRMVRGAFPDFHNTVEDMVAEGEQVAARLAYRGTHRGELFGIGPTGRTVHYPGVAFFRVVAGKIVNGWVLGDTASLFQQLGVAELSTAPRQTERTTSPGDGRGVPT